MRDKIVQSLVFGATAGGVTAGSIVLITTGFQSEDILAFAGAVVGAGATVGGAAWLADRSHNRERRSEQSLIHEELEILCQLATRAAATSPANSGRTDEWRSSLNALIDVSRSSIRFLDEVTATARTLDFHQREVVKLVREAAGQFIRFHDDVFSEAELEHWDDRTWASEIEPLARESSYALSRFRMQ